MGNNSNALSTLIQNVAQSFGDYVQGVPGATSTVSTVVCTTLLKPDDYYNGGDLHIYAGTHIDTNREITDWVLSTNTLSFSPVVVGAVDATDLFIILRQFSYNQYKNAINMAIISAQSNYLLNKSETIYQNRLTNGNFENGTTGWTLTGAGATGAASTAQVKEQAYSMKIIRAGADCYEAQSIAKYGDFLDQTMTFQCWVWASVDDRAFIRVNDGVANHDSTYHTGSSSWELLSVTVSVSDVATELTAKLCVSNGNTTCYFDQAVLQEDGCLEAPVPTGFKYISEIWYEDVAGSGQFTYKIPSKAWWIVKDAASPMIHFSEPWGTDRLLVIGQSVQAELTTDASICYMPASYVVQAARTGLMSMRPEYEKILNMNIAIAGREMNALVTPPLIGSRAIWEL
jgi:hypothetical protein